MELTCGLSVIIPVKNKELLIGSVLDSILPWIKETINSELIIVDNKSVDRTFSIIYSKIANIPNAHLYLCKEDYRRCGKESIGMPNAYSEFYNYCISKATKYNICLWDSNCIMMLDEWKRMVGSMFLLGRNDVFEIFLRGKTNYFSRGKTYLDTLGQIGKYRIFSLLNGVKFSSNENGYPELCKEYMDKLTSLLECQKIINKVSITVSDKKLVCTEIIYNEIILDKYSELWGNFSEIDVTKAKIIYNLQEIREDKEKRLVQIENFVKLSPPRFKIVIPSYKCGPWIEKCLDSIKAQTYTNYDVVVCEDASPEGYRDDVRQKIITKCKDYSWMYMFNNKNVTALANIKFMIDYIMPKEEDVIIIIDGDDWLPDNDVFNVLAKEYQKGCMMTYGNYQFHCPDKGEESKWSLVHNSKGPIYKLPIKIEREKEFREHPWQFSHIKTFKYCLWRRINDEDMYDKEKDWFYDVTYDMAIMYPVMEMAKMHTFFVDRIMYIYNCTNPLNDFKVRGGDQVAVEKVLRFNTPKYPTIY